MRIHSSSVRLGYSLTWSYKFLYDYFINVRKSYQFEFLIQNLIGLNRLKRYLLFSDVVMKVYNKNYIRLYLYVYSYRYKQFIESFEDDSIKNYMSHCYLRPLLYKISTLLKRDLRQNLDIFFILVRNHYFNANLSSLFIVSKLMNRFKLEQVVSELKDNLIEEKKGLLVICSGRFDRKERASSHIFSYGKLSLSTLDNQISYHNRTVTLKYGICGIKVWTLK